MLTRGSEIGIPGGIGKHLADYDVDDAHVRGAKYANQYLGMEFSKGPPQGGKDGSSETSG